jgi:hypothetical protein
MGEPVKFVETGYGRRLQQILTARGMDPGLVLDPVASGEHDVETPEERAARRARRPRGWVDAVPAAFGTAALADLTREQDPGGVIGRWADDPTPFLLLGGEARSGKTHAAIAVGKVVAERVRVMFLTARDLFDRLRDEQTAPGRPLLGTVKMVGCLIVDDLGTKGAPSAWEVDTFLHIIDARLTDSRSTVITTNQSTQQLSATWGERVGRRLTEGRSTLVKVGRRNLP